MTPALRRLPLTFILASMLSGSIALAQEAAPTPQVEAESSPTGEPGTEPTLPRDTPAEKLRQWDQTMDQVRKALWQMQSAPQAQIKDSRGRTMADDLNDHILPESVTA